MKNIVLCIIFLLSVNFSYAQTINVRVVNLNEVNVALSSLSGEKISFIDSIIVDEVEFKFNLTNKHPGFYRILFNKSNPSLQGRAETSILDFVYDYEEIELETDANNILDSLKILKSESNKIYYEFIKLNKDYKIKTELLSLILARYPVMDDYYNTSKEKLIETQEDYLYFVNVTSQSNPNSFIARYVRTARLPFIEAEVPFDEQLLYLKTHSLDYVNFNDDGLIYSDAFTNKAIEYLTFYRNPQLPLELLEKEFESAIDTILSKAKVNEIVYKHITEYLLDGFKKFGFDNVINYIVENYVIKDDICLDEKLESALERRIQQARNFKIGSSVPNIGLQDMNGREIDLHKLQAEKVLIVFYSTNCPHCTELLPELHELYKTKNNKEFEVLAISLDEDKSALQSYLKANNFDWINVNDTSGWKSKAAIDYYIYATPTMFLIDKEKKILTMPKNIEGMK